MTAQAFDDKNKLDFDKNTELLAQGIMQIASDKSLKPTAAELGRITGIHRNTIRQRRWPLERLEAIKDTRRMEVLAQRVKTEKKQDPKTILMQRLEKSRLEVLYWFNRFQEAESSFASIDKRLSTVRESRDYYVQVTEEQRSTIKQQETEIQKLRDALQLVSANLEESK
ncbi:MULTISPECIES: hypothetical protein [Pseudomonas syringae group genomosp. 2]|uniref:Uncharacterized protein n=1 Tax=Pseudomonas amygdali pv. tabaci TaxID=322 RepID=A0A3M6GDS1_PSEAJ|nr:MULTISPECIES: hypothetical protein [Pseudomonas syringae group genomosp. 2]QOI07294.1 hypothetical protein D5S10_27815 [Pseudomonas savastanoi]RMV90594.1 hypothetical protein ALP03_200088 [Pseudomonas amygdali pv. tabaci]